MYSARKGRLLFIVFGLLILSLAAATPQKAEPRYNKIILVSYDGVRKLWLDQLIQNGSAVHMRRLVEDGGMITLHLVGHTSSTDPGLACIESGYGPDINGIHSNTFGSAPEMKRSIRDNLTIFERIKAEHGDEWKTALLMPWGNSPVNVSSTYDATYWNASESIDFWYCSENFTWSTSNPDYEEAAFSPRALMKASYLSEKLVDFIHANKDTNFYARIHFTEPDAIGHSYAESVAGKPTPEYLESILWCDEALGKILEALDDCGIYDETVIFVTTDHGFHEGGHGGAMPEISAAIYETFLIFSKKDIYVGVDKGIQDDIAPTILALAGINVNKLEPKYAETSGATPIFRYDESGRDLDPPEVVSVDYEPGVEDGAQARIVMRLRDPSGVSFAKMYYTYGPAGFLAAYGKQTSREGDETVYEIFTLPLKADIEYTEFYVDIFDASLTINHLRYPSSGEDRIEVFQQSNVMIYVGGAVIGASIVAIIVLLTLRSRRASAKARE